MLLYPPSYGRRCRVLVVCGVFLAGTDRPASRARVVRHPFVLAGSDGPASRAHAVRHPVFLFRGCRRPAARGPLLARVCAVPGLALVFVAACCCPPPPPPPHPALPLVVFRPSPLLLGVPRPPAVVAPPPLPPRGDAFLGWWCPASRLPLLPLCFVVALRCLAVCRRLLWPPPPIPPPPPRVLSTGCWHLLLVFPCPPASALFFPCLWPWTCLVGFLFPPSARAGAVHPPPPPGNCSAWCAVPRVLCCGAAVGCGLLCAARGVLLRRAVLLCGSLAVCCAPLLRRWPSLVGVLFVGVARCSALPCCFVGCFVVCGAVVRCRVLCCCPCCCVVSWLFSLCLLGSAHLWVCAGWCCPPPPPPGFRVVPSAGLCCRGVLACSALCGAVLLLAALCCTGCGVPCRVVPCPVVPRGWRGAALRFLVRLRPAACSAACVLGGAVLCCRALRRSLGCCVLVLCALLSRCVLLWVALCCLVSVGVVRLAACCAALLFAAVCCAAPLGVVSGCAVLCCPRCGLLFRFGRATLCCAVPPGAVSGRVASCCAVWCSAAVHRAVGVALCCVVSRSAVPLPYCGVPSGAVRCLGCCVLCCALCCAAVFCAVPGGEVSWCAVLCCSRLAVWSGSVFLCGVLCLLVLWCSGLRLVVSCGVVLSRTVLSAWCCAVFVRAVWCCCVLCPALGCCASLWGAVPFGAVLCCVAPCCARCAVCVVPLCCGVCCFCCCPLCCWHPVVLPPCIFKTRKNCFLFLKTEKIVSRWFALCTLSSLHATVPHTEETSLLYLFNSWPWAGVHHRSRS